MKKTYFLSLALLIGSAIFSQSIVRRSAASSTVQFGIKGGVNLATYESSIYTSTSNRTGYHAGLLAHIHLTPNFALQPEVLYSAQGSKFTNNSSYLDKLNYVNIPVLLQYMTRSGFRLETGPQLGLLTTAKSKNVTTNVETDIKNVVKSTDFSWAFGLGYLSSSGLGVDARYNLGLSDISSAGRDLKNRVWQFGLFYQFKQ